MPNSPILVSGPARSGKTQWLISRYRSTLAQPPADSPFASILWISPNQRSAQTVRQQLLSDQLTACFEPGITTFDHFAEKVLGTFDDQIPDVSAQSDPEENSSDEVVHMLSPSQQRLLLQSIIQTALHKDQIPYFAAIAETDGFLDLVIELIRELKRLEIWPEELAEAARRNAQTPKDLELVIIYEAYQAVLNAHQLYDPQGRFWSARTRLKNNRSSAYKKLDLLVVDGFTDFTRPQHDILVTLAARANQTLISLSIENESTRPDLFSKTMKTRRELFERHPSLKLKQFERRETHWPAMDHIEREVFKNPRDVQPFSQSKTRTENPRSEPRIEIIAASGKLGELEALASRIKSLILSQGVSPSQIAIVFRSPGESAPLAREVFNRFGIPTAFEFQKTLDAAPILRALHTILRLDLEDWPFRLLLQVLGNDYLRPMEATPEAASRESEAALQMVRRLQIPSGRDALLREIDFWSGQANTTKANTEQAGETQDTSPPDSDQKRFPSRRAEWAATSAPLFHALKNSFDALPKQATLDQWLGALRDFVDQLGLLQAESIRSQRSHKYSTTKTLEAFNALDRQAWAQLETLFEAAHQASEWHDISTESQLTRQELAAFLSDALRTETLAGQQDETGRVRVLSAQSARNLQLDYLFLAGLTERSFPAAEREDRLLSEADVGRLASSGLPLADRRSRMCDEMLLFYEVVTLAKKQLTLSYPALDDKAQSLLPSPYLQEIEKLFPQDGIQRTDETNLSPIPNTPTPLSPRDQRIDAVAHSLASDPKPLASLIKQGQTSSRLQDTATPLIEGLATVAERRKADQFGPHEGILLSDKARNILTERFGPKHLWSPSRLEQFAKCPYQFFLERVLEVRPLDELSLETDYFRRGRVLHDALATIHENLNRAADHHAALGEVGEEHFAKEFSDIVQSLLESEPKFGKVDQALAELDRREVSGWGQRYYQQHLKYEKAWNELDQPLRPAHFEVRFGPSQNAPDEHDSGPSEDPLSTDEPFAFDLGGESVLLTGRIDRLDLGMIGSQPVFNVIDYKSGKRAALKIETIEEGLALQLPLYSIAVEEMLLVQENASPYQAGYWSLQGSGYSLKQSLKMSEINENQTDHTPEWLALRTAVQERIKTIIHSMRQGEFPVFSKDDQCTSTCAYHTVCRVNQIRSLAKQWPTPPDC